MKAHLPSAARGAAGVVALGSQPAAQGGFDSLGCHAEALAEGTLLPAPEAEEVDEGAVVAPSAAMVTAVHVAAGDTVEEGQPLVTVEAMKMLTVLKAPRAGLVEALNCVAGDSVASGQVLIELAGEDEE